MQLNRIALSGAALNGITFSGAALNGVALNEFMPVKVNKNANPVKNTFLKKPKYFYIILFFFIKYLRMSKISSTAIAS